MLLDLVEIRTDDGLRLPGGFFSPASPPRRGAVDAVLIITGTFSQDLWTTLASRLAAAGYPALTVSARTHAVDWLDLDTNTHWGSAYQTIAQIPLDYHAAVRTLRDRGYQRLALFGHSIAGTRALWYAAHDPDPALVAVISSAGPSFSEETFAPRAAEFAAARARAEALVAEGRGRELTRFDFPQQNAVLTPESWLDTYCGGHYDVRRWLHRLRVPVLRLECEREAPANLPLIEPFWDDFRRLAPPHPRHRKVVVGGADHSYRSGLSAAGDAVVDWLATLDEAAAK
jgi:dienelactone hydrolase